MNLQEGYEVLEEQLKGIEDKPLYTLLSLYGKLEVLIYKAFKSKDTKIIAYKAQNLQYKIFDEINEGK